MRTSQLQMLVSGKGTKQENRLVAHGKLDAGNYIYSSLTEKHLSVRKGIDFANELLPI